MSLLLGQRSRPGLATARPGGLPSGLHAGWAHRLRSSASQQPSSTGKLHAASITTPAASDLGLPTPEEGNKDSKSLELPATGGVDITVQDVPVHHLNSMITDGIINMRPSYQRSLVWDRPRASKLVLTVLQNRLVPTIYLEEVEPTEEEPTLKYRVLDGKQRLGSLFAFRFGSDCMKLITGPGKDGNTRWQGAPIVLKVNEELEWSSSSTKKYNGRSYNNLTAEDKAAFNDFEIKVVIIGKSTEREVILKIFQDINTGSVNHSIQQSRRAVYWGDYIDMLEELAYLKEFMLIRNPDNPRVDNKLERDREMILRFFAMRRSAKDYKGPVDSFLNKEIHTYRNISQDDCSKLSSMFKATAQTVWDIWGPEACRQLPGTKGSTELVPALFDAVMVAVCDELHPAGMKKSTQRQTDLLVNADKVQGLYKELLDDPSFKAYMSSATPTAVMKRIDMFKDKVREVPHVQPPRDETRNFTKKQKAEIWRQHERPTADNNGKVVICPRCKKAIREIDQAEADHILPHAHGSRTELGNMQLLHWWCNMLKGANLEPQQQETKEPQQQEEGPQRVQPEQQQGNGAVSSSASSSAASRRRSRRQP